MPEIATPYAPGSPCGVYLVPDDQPATLDFYRDLLGWKGDPGDPGDHVICELNGKAVALIGSAKFHDKKGMPTPRNRWLPLLTSTDAEATARAIRKAGGRRVTAVENVGKLGKLLVADDGLGAQFGVWQPGEFSGAQVTHETGAVNWIELYTSNMEVAMPFYREVFGFEYDSRDHTIRLGDREIGGVNEVGRAGFYGRPPYWLPYFQVDDVNSSKDNLGRLGGGLVYQGGAKVNGSNTWRVVAQDPVRAPFALTSPSTSASAAT
ncbi:VOC family protein [Streptomyces anulatus]|uniref:VOC family protein n=1 Tax=Streptomyces TaxID=1883 RepID=UPI000BFBA220|nr:MULTISPECIES: VOC family protein [Streptomyces]MCX4502187.1 VOC family protein [Streptomyces anulatus]WTC75289.1 VOC family protein [Streptomyces anulatus]WUD87324.1 VOC family protein [Streptomyces anulatus]